MTLASNIHAVLLAACVGDALGAATEGMHRDDIATVFGGPITRLRPAPPLAPFALGLQPGRLTDDATQMLCMAKIAIRAKGNPTLDDAIDGLLLWTADTEMFTRFAGPTTRIALEKLRSGIEARDVADPGVYSCVFGTSNGAAMRAPVAGCLRPGDIEGAAGIAVTFSAPTHNTQIAYAGAAAVAGAIAHGLAGGTRDNLMGAAIKAARIGEVEAKRNGRLTGGADLVRRLEMAADIGRRFIGRPRAAMTELEAVIGNGIAMVEAVPVAFGLVIAAEFSPWQAILAAVNGGNDSDTIAMFAGAIAAAFGTDDLDGKVAAEVQRVNALTLRDLAAQLAEVAHA
ncbi:ADP-ribosylglycohydrolase family protein [Rhizobium lusitanum]|uniref:ADP-ribosylglycohydrolase family protein n=1 Tax=Rhizobium lusitanum TaxID=293958 RepID=UPI00195BD986|nr:ADP-ribosylglycohydrolase family protein [Rhizobium lusitanum]MBM7049241.1 ADP-ribosylglycohydrolase family protein [Rhizobium lusitanum]